MGPPTALGGRYNWEGASTYWKNYPNESGYIGISIDGATAPQKDLRFLDRLLDDGNLLTGKFRKIGSRYTHTIDEN